MKTVLKIFALSLFAFFSLIFSWIYFFGPEQYFVFDPYIDTQWNNKFSPAKFAMIEHELDSTLVVEFLGQPISREFYEDSKTVFTYTQDGRLMDIETPWFMCSDYAWCEFGITIDSTGQVSSKGKGWRYD
jgi:hypothetical protein